MALTNKQIKKKLRQLARQDAPIRCGDLREAGPYQFSSPQPPQPQRKWVSRIAVCAACVAVAVSAVLLASPILSDKALPIASADESRLPSATESSAEHSPIPITWMESVRGHVPYEGPEAAINAPIIKRLRSVEEFREHLVYYPEFIPGFDGWGLISDYRGVQYGILEYCLQENLYDDHELIWIRMTSPSSSNLYFVEGVERTGTEAVTVRLMEVSPWATLCDLGCWEFFLLLPRELLREGDTITVQMEQTHERYQARLSQEDWDAAEAAAGSFDRYYGAYGDCLVVGSTVDASEVIGPDEIPAAETVCGRVFNDNLYNRIEILHGGERCSITAAYENGWLTNEDVEELYWALRIDRGHDYQASFYHGDSVVSP